MKRKFLFFMMFLLVLPVFALFGCEKPQYYNFSVRSTGDGTITINGESLKGSASVEEGESVTIVAVAKNQEFLGWVFQNSTLLSDNSTYSIKDTTSDGKVVKSVLTFKSSKSTNGGYTAVFNDGKLTYSRLSAWKITSDEDATSEIDSAAKQYVMKLSNLSLVHEKTGNLVYNVDGEVSVKDNVEIRANDVSELLYVDGETSQNIILSTNISYNDSASYQRNFRANIQYRQSAVVDQPAKDGKKDYTFSVSYSDGVYKVAFGFEVSATQTYYLVLYYKELGL